MGSPNKTSFWLLLLGLSGLATSFQVFIWLYDAPYAHATRGDNFIAFLPTIKAHTDGLMALNFPKAIWGIGAGWDPFESGQMGIFYPLYHLANLISRLLGKPLALLEVSYVLHQILLIWMILRWTTGSHMKRAGLVLVLVFAPAPFILGLNWHLYGISHIWFIGMLLYLERYDYFQNDPKRLKHSVVLLVMNALFFIAAHPQMFVWGELFLGVWVLCFAPTKKSKLQTLWLVFLVNLPVVPSLIYLKWVSLLATPNMMVFRSSSAGLMHFSQDLHVALGATFLGNFMSDDQFILWSDKIGKGGIGLFFQPIWGVTLVLALMRRRWGVTAFLIFLMVMLGVRTFPWMEYLAVGPFRGFRWTWKLAIYASPIGVLMLIKLAQERSRWVSPLLIGTGLVSMLICFQGRHFNLSAALSLLHPYGLAEILDETRACLDEIEVPESARLAHVGDHSMEEPAPIIVMGLMGNTALLVDRGTIHIYNPLERREAAEGHLQITVPWRVHLDTEEFLGNQDSIESAFRFIGVTHLYSADRRLAPKQKARTCTDRLGREVYFWPLANARTTPYPHPMSLEAEDNVTVRSDGTLFVATDSNETPQLNVTREIAWEKTDTGWLGHPQPLHPGWFLATVLLLFGVLAWLRRWGQDGAAIQDKFQH